MILFTREIVKVSFSTSQMENYERFGKVNIQMLLVLLHLPSDSLTMLSHLVLVTDTSTDSPYSVLIDAVIAQPSTGNICCCALGKYESSAPP